MGTPQRSSAPCNPRSPESVSTLSITSADISIGWPDCPLHTGQASGAPLARSARTVAAVNSGTSTGVNSTTSHLPCRYSRPIFAESNICVLA